MPRSSALALATGQVTMRDSAATASSMRMASRAESDWVSPGIAAAAV